jgi:phosphate transport system substrate-binding protein
MKKSSLIFLISLPLIFVACNNSSEKKENKPVTLYLEESFKPLFETSIYTFEGQNPLADFDAHYVTEVEAIEALIENKTSTISITRDFTEEEKARLRLSKIEVRSDKVAKDAVAIIINPQNPDSTLTVDQIKRIIAGKDTVWNGLKTSINVVFDNINSANFNYMTQLAGIKSVSKNVFAVKSNEEVIEYVKNNKSAIGIIGVNWISDEDDPETLSFRDGLTVVAVAEEEGKEYFKPYQAYIYTKEYPLTRELWMINKAGRTSKNTAFILFMLGDKGQLIIQKSSLIPANMVARMIQMKTEE